MQKLHRQSTFCTNVPYHVGQRFKVVNEDVTLEIVSLQADVSLAKIIKGEKVLVNGLRIEVLAEKK